jgi:hypothetical protein
LYKAAWCSFQPLICCVSNMHIDLCSLSLDLLDLISLETSLGLESVAEHRQPPVNKLFLNQLPPAIGSVLVNWSLTTSANLDVGVGHQLFVSQKCKRQLLGLGFGENCLLEVLERRCSVHDNI